MKEPVLYKVVRPIIKGLFCFLYRPKIEGCENIPLDGRIVLAGNHTDYFDCLLLMSSTKRVIHFLAKKELMSGVLGFVFRNMGIIPVDRKIHDKDALKSAIEVLNDDKVIGIFPEGTFHRGDGVILPFKIGAVKMASVSGSKVVPFVITGRYRIFFKSNLRICFFPPMEVASSGDLTTYNEKLMNIISDEIRKRV